MVLESNSFNVLFGGISIGGDAPVEKYFSYKKSCCDRIR